MDEKDKACRETRHAIRQERETRSGTSLLAFGSSTKCIPAVFKFGHSVAIYKVFGG